MKENVKKELTSETENAASVPSQRPIFGYRYLTDSAYRKIVTMPVTSKGLVKALENSIPLDL